MSNDPSDAEAFEHGFHRLPHPKQRAAMSPEKLAIVLSEQKAGTPAYILVEHELNLRLARVQSNATMNAAFVGLGGVIVGALLTVWLQSLPQDHPHADKPKAEVNPDSATKKRTDESLAAGKQSIVPSVQPEKQPTEPKKHGAKP